VIVVTGMQRSGTSYAGNKLATLIEYCQVFEPFNPRFGLDRFDQKPYPTSVSYVQEKLGELNKIRSFWVRKGNRTIVHRQYLKLQINNLSFKYPLLVKDPFLCMVAAELSDLYKTAYVYKDPDLFVSSNLKRGFTFEKFPDFLSESAPSYFKEVEFALADVRSRLYIFYWYSLNKALASKNISFIEFDENIDAKLIHFVSVVAKSESRLDVFSWIDNFGRKEMMKTGDSFSRKTFIRNSDAYKCDVISGDAFEYRMAAYKVYEQANSRQSIC